MNDVDVTRFITELVEHIVAQRISPQIIALHVEAAMAKFKIQGGQQTNVQGSGFNWSVSHVPEAKVTEPKPVINSVPLDVCNDDGDIVTYDFVIK